MVWDARTQRDKLEIDAWRRRALQLPLTPSSLRVASGRIVKKYEKLRAIASPLSENVRRRLLAKIGGGTCTSPATVMDDGDDCHQQVEPAQVIC